ncbi:alpha-galactosidase [Glaciihabitans sp. dw_435]|uniref:alpha-galactosidase n=1 Tax=Glaciihabitans sp. dw_435 TaxID=2720081 RepID=UPI0027DCA549|nr:alpha-galactosidase [Glaciihabitans sp. dw_435]
MLDARGTAVPTFIHWGTDLGELSQSDLEALADAAVPAVGFSSPDLPLRSTVLPTIDAGWQGRPALSGHGVGSATGGAWELVSVTPRAEASVVLLLRSAALDVALDYELTPEGLLRARAAVVNTAATGYALEQLNVILPVAAQATEVLDFAGHWSAERQPQRRDLATGSWAREIRHGRPGHDAPFVTVAGTPGFGFRSGETWGVHLAWSGNHRVWVESQVYGPAVMGLGELLASDEVVLAPGERYETPWAIGSFSAVGLDGVSARFHRYLRRTSRRAASDAVRPVILNTWEAVYFDHDLTTLRSLADVGAEVGVERFVLDDGWMSRRTNDARGLGDWVIDAERWPGGLGPIASYVTSLGMDFGLWVEPEMLNLDSDVAREHPEWVLSTVAGEPGLTARNQYVLDLTQPAAYASVLARLSALLDDYPIAYLKWDHNRDLFTASSHDQTLAAYRLMDELLAAHPGVEIESCASGGGRIDLEILGRTTRVWPSDTNDPLQRQSIYRWTSTLIPPEFFGAHLGAATAHTTGRTHGLAFRFATALFGWAGIEWDITRATPDERVAVATWLREYKALRPLLHSGTVVRADPTDPTQWVHGVVADDRSAAVFAVVSTAISPQSVLPPVRLPGLDPLARYRVEVIDLGAPPRYFAVALPAWMTTDAASPLELSGAVLGEVGVAAPPLAPEQAVVLRVTRVENG